MNPGIYWVKLGEEWVLLEYTIIMEKGVWFSMGSDQPMCVDGHEIDERPVERSIENDKAPKSV